MLSVCTDELISTPTIITPNIIKNIMKKVAPLCSGNVSKDFSADDTKL